MRRKIFFLIPLATGGGAEKVVQHILRHLDRKKFAPSLVLFENKETASHGFPPDVKITVLKNESRRYGLQYLIFLKLARLLKKDKPDVLISFMWYPNAVALAAITVARLKLKVIVSERIATVIYEGKLMNFLRSAVIRTFYPRADMVVLPSQVMADDIHLRYGIPEKKTRVIYNPLDIDSIRLKAMESLDHPWHENGESIIVAIGRLGIQKGFSFLIRAAACLAGERIGFKLIIFGEGHGKEALLRLVRDLSLEDTVSFPGYQENPYKYLVRSTVFVLSSLYEGLPNALLEALALGVPSIATRCQTGPEEIITDGVNGLLVPPADEKALAEAIKRVLSDPELRRKLADGGRKRAEDFSVKKIIKEYETLIEEVCAERQD